MRLMGALVFIFAAHPLSGQVRPAPTPPFEDTVFVQGVPVLSDEIPLTGAQFRQNPARPIEPVLIDEIKLILDPVPNSAGELQKAIDTTMNSTANTVLVMDLDSVMLSRASIPLKGDFPDSTLQRLVKNLKSIQLRMFDLDGDVRSKLQPVRGLLKSPRWVRYSAYTSADEQIEIWSARSGNAQTGVFLLSLNGRRVFTMNVGGDMGPAELVHLSGLFGLPNFKPKLELPLNAPAPRKD